MYKVIGMEGFTNTETHKSGIAYFCARDLGEDRNGRKLGLKPEFTYYAYDDCGISVGDDVFPEISTGKDGKIFIRGIQKI